MHFCCRQKHIDQFASTLLFWLCIFDCPHFNVWKWWSCALWHKLNSMTIPQLQHTRLWYFLVMLFLLMRFWLFSTVHTHTIYMWIRFAPLLRCIFLDCEQSLFFFRFSKGSAHARASGEAARRAKRGRQPEKKKRDSLFSCLSHLAPSVSRVAIRVSRVLLDGLQKKERLLVVYIFQTDALSMKTLSILEGLNLLTCKHFQTKTH